MNCKKTECNARITEIDDKTPSITGLANVAALNAVENKIPNVSDLVKKEIKMQKYQKLRLNISPHLIAINLRLKNLM